MGKYTVLEDPEADAAVQGVLDKVCEGIATLLGDSLQAIVLVGGYGRGEGGVFHNGTGYCLVNDLDLLAFAKGSLRRAKARFDSPLKQLSERLLTHGRGLKKIDIDLTHVRCYQCLVPNTVGHYEIAEGHQVVYGDMDLRKVMPRLDSRRLPLYEGTNYFRNRGSGLLIAAVYFLTDGLKNSKNRRNFQIELQKACQAMGDACLLRAEQYHYSYQERLCRFHELENDKLGVPVDLFQQVGPFYQWGMMRKLRPEFDWTGDEEMICKWFEVQRTFDKFFLWYESKRLGCDFQGWDEYAIHVERYGASEPWSRRLRSGISIALSLLRGWPGRNAQGLSPLDHLRRGLITMPLLLFSLTPDLRVNPSLVASAAHILGQPVEEEDLNLWKQLVKEHLLAYYPGHFIMDSVIPLLDV